jgi:hypothetical protein
MDTEKQYREAMFKKITDYLEMAKENTLSQDPNPHTAAMNTFIANLIKMTKAMNNVKDSNSFISVAKGLEMVLEKEFFSQITPKKKPIDVADTKRESEENFNVKAHIVGMDNPDELPRPVRLKLAEALKAMGVSQEDIDNQLNL